jgi:hypothetical protein
MRVSEQPETVTLVACPAPGAMGSASNSFIDDALDALDKRNAASNRIIRVCSVRDIDVELGKILTASFKGTIRLQIIGHSISGLLSLGASWIAEGDMSAVAFKYPYYVLDTNPASLGLLAKYAGKISEVMLVGCNIGSAASYGYAINGRTLTYTLAELLRCLVRGADDVVAPDEFDTRGWYTPNAYHRRPKGWRWVDAMPPVWTDPGLDPVPGPRPRNAQSFEILSITSSLLPIAAPIQQVDIDPGLRISCQPILTDKPLSALPEVSIETDKGPAQLLCGGRYLSWAGVYYSLEHNRQLSVALTEGLWSLAAA